MIELLHLLIWNFFSCLKISHINPNVVIKENMLGSSIVLINIKYFSCLSLLFVSYSLPNVILNDWTWWWDPVHQLKILFDSIFNDLKFLIFNLRSKMIKKLFFWIALNSIKWICHQENFITKSEIHSFRSDFQIRAFLLIKEYFMSIIFSIKCRMISIAKLIKLLDCDWNFSSHWSKHDFEVSSLFLKP